MCRQILVTGPSIIFQDNPAGGANLLHENRHTDTDVTTLNVSFPNRANVINSIHVLMGSEN